jgi:hypothetical protein
MQSAVTVDSSPRLFALLVVDAGIRNDKWIVGGMMFVD